MKRRNQRKPEETYTLVGITHGARTADYFVVLAVNDVDLVIPDSAWEQLIWEQLRQRRAGSAR